MNNTDIFYIILIAGLFLLLVLSLIWFIRLRSKKRKAMPSHLQLYFDENFRKIMTEWDFTTRDRVKTFKKDIGTRLSKVDSDIGVFEKKKQNLDQRMNRIETHIGKLEGF
jgi:peptidoglycan hydrolase CwlO-like protein